MRVFRECFAEETDKRIATAFLVCMMVVNEECSLELCKDM
jgi:hypothetical protein